MTWPGVSGEGLTIACGDDSFTATAGMDATNGWGTSKVRRGSTITLTSSNVNKMFTVKVGDADPVPQGTPSATARTTIEIEVGTEPIVITEVNAVRPVYVRLLNGSSKIAVGTPLAGTILGLSSDSAASVSVINPWNPEATVVEVPAEGDYRPGSGTTYKANTTYAVTVKGIVPADNYTFGGLTGGDIQLVTTDTGTVMAGWSIQSASVKVSNDGTMDLEMTVYSGSLT